MNEGDIPSQQPISVMNNTELDAVLKALSSRRARHVCYFLESDDISEIDVIYLARQVAVWETGSDMLEVPTETVNRISVDLHHRTLPALEKAGYLHYDPQTGRIHYKQPSEVFRRVLDLCKSIERPG